MSSGGYYANINNGYPDSFDILMMQTGIPLVTIVAAAGIIGILVAIMAYWKLIHIPRQTAKKIEVTKKFIENGKLQGGVDNYTVSENTPLWYMGTIFASHTKKKGAK